MEDISLKKREIEAKSEEEKASIQWLKDSLSKSNNLANNMLNILTSFEDRLCKLEDTILPVHKETTDLQRRQDNVEKSLHLLDDVLSYHSVSSNLKPLIEEGPSGKLNEYLGSMEKIDQAIRFFKKNSPDSIELSVLESLNETARDSLEKEFLMLLKRNSKPVPVVTIQDILNAMVENSDNNSELDAEEDPIQHFSEKVMNELATIATWLTEHKKGVDFMSMYSQYRSTMLLQSLQGIKREGFKFNFEGIVGKKKAPMKRQVTDMYMKKKLGPRKSTKQETYYGHKKQPSSYEQVLDEDENSEASTFITCTGALLKLIQSENQLMQFIIPEERQIPIFSQLVAETLTAYFTDAEALCASAKRVQNKLDHSSIQMILPVLKYLYVVKPDFNTLLKVMNVDTRKIFLNVISLFEETGRNILHDFQEKLQESDKHVNMPKDGTVHQITSNVTIFLEELIQYLDTTAAILSSSDSKSPTEDINSKEIVSTYISTILSGLSSNLNIKAKFYDTSALRYIFLLNNFNYIVKSLHKIDIMTMLQEHGHPNLGNDYDDEIKDALKKYEKSWTRVSQHLEMDPGDKVLEAAGKGHLKDKHKQAIKDKFKGFNTELEDIQQLHRQFTVPDMMLKKRIFDRICGLIVPKYSDFLARYRDVHFTKNVEKYVKYDLDKVRSLIASVYDVDEKQLVNS